MTIFPARRYDAEPSAGPGHTAAGTPRPPTSTITAALAHAVVDLVPATKAHDQIIEVFVWRWGGSVALRVPDRWLILVGRVRPLSASFVLIGPVDSTKVFADPADEAVRGEIGELLQEADQSADSPGGTASPPRVAVVVVHVLGIGGSVRTAKGAASS